MPRRLMILAGLIALAAWAPVRAQQSLKLIHSVAPKYPQEAKDKKIEGDVVLHIEINEEGAVHDPWVISGPKELRDAALEAVRQWKYSKDGPLPASSEVTLAFQLPKKDYPRLTSGATCRGRIAIANAPISATASTVPMAIV